MSKHKEALRVKTFKTTKENTGIIHKAFNYRKSNTLANCDINWRCISKTCSASLKTCGSIKTIKIKSGSHNHSAPATDPSLPSVATTPSYHSQTTKTTPSNDSISSQSSETLSDAAASPSLTELVSPYMTITPVPPTYLCKEKENEHLRQRVAEI